MSNALIVALGGGIPALYVLIYVMTTIRAVESARREESALDVATKKPSTLQLVELR